MKKIILFVAIFGVILATSACSEKAPVPPLAAKFNSYLATLANYNQGYIDIENKLCAAAGKSDNEKNILFDNAVSELKAINVNINKTDAPLELTALKNLFMARNEALIVQFQFAKKSLLAGSNLSLEAEEEEGVVSANLLTIDGRIEALIKSIEEVNQVKCLNSSATTGLLRLKGNKYFTDVK